MVKTMQQIESAILPASTGRELLQTELQRIETIAEKAVRRLSTNKRSIVGSVAELVAAGHAALSARQPIGVAIWREGIDRSRQLRALWQLTPELDPKSYSGWLETDSGKNAVSLLAAALPEKCRSLVPCLLAGLTVPQSAKTTGVCARTIKNRRREIRQEAHRVAEIQDRLMPLFTDDNPTVEPDRHCRSLSNQEWLRVAADFSRVATAGNSRRLTSVPRVATIRPDSATLTEYTSTRRYARQRTMPAIGAARYAKRRPRPLRPMAERSVSAMTRRQLDARQSAVPHIASGHRVDGLRTIRPAQRTPAIVWSRELYRRPVPIVPDDQIGDIWQTNEQLAMVSRPPQQPVQPAPTGATWWVAWNRYIDDPRENIPVVEVNDRTQRWNAYREQLQSGLTAETAQRLRDRYTRAVRNWLETNALDGVC